jgi:uncharacterized repeat protein (TIGR03803 family)
VNAPSVLSITLLAALAVLAQLAAAASIPWGLKRRTRVLAARVVLALVLSSSIPAFGGTIKVLYGFRGGADGAAPVGSLLIDAEGQLYGATSSGGYGGNGTIFRLVGGKESVLYRFKGTPDGSAPSGGLIMDAGGSLYGVTAAGGTLGCGTVFKLTPSGEESVLHSFCSNGQDDGIGPEGSLVMNGAGDLFGTTRLGGVMGSGALFKVDPSGHETVIHSFCTKGGNRCTDGEEPADGPVRDAGGTLFGATAINFGATGMHGGGVFRVTPDGKESVLYIFCSAANCADGQDPNGQLLLSDHTLYGTTVSGGLCQFSDQNDPFCGTVFSVSLDEKNKETVLYRFCSAADCADGSLPSPGLVMDSKGDLFGTTNFGGNASCEGGGFPGCGTVFSLSPTGEQTVLHAFTGIGTDGAFPTSGVILDRHGNIFGTTTGGGEKGNGIVFEICSRAHQSW